MDFTNFNINEMKIFKSLLSLEYKDSKLESWYQSLSNQNMRRVLNFSSQFLLFFGIFLTTLEGVLYLTPGKLVDRNLKWNFYFTALHLLMSVLIFATTHFSKIVTENVYIKYLIQFLIHFAFENFFLSLISILLVYFHLGIEIISFAFFAQTVTKCLLSFFLHRSFINSLINIAICFSFKVIFLFGIHVIKAIIYYLIVHLAFLSIVLAFVYMYEHMTRKFFYSFLKLAKEKEYFLDTLNFFNISYFSSRNRHLKKAIKLDFLLKNLKAKNLKPMTLAPIEELIRTSLVSIDHLPSDIEQYLINCKNTKNFKFKKLIKILRSKEENKNFFKKFANTGILKIPNAAGNKEDIYVQVFLKIKIKNIKKGIISSSSDDFLLSCLENTESFNADTFEEGLDVKIEGLFLDVSQVYMKKETQVNSYILAKYIHDIKSPLFLLQQMVENYKHFVKSKMRTISLLVENKKLHHKMSQDKAEQNEYLNNLKTLSKHIFEIIENINNFTKTQNNLCNVNSETDTCKVDIRKLMNRCLEFFKIYTKFNSTKKNVRVYAEVEGHVPQFIYSNKKALKHILMNLLSNSMKFTYHGEIKVVCKLKSKLELSEERKFIEINVIDTGIGIDEENLKQISKPFSFTTSKDSQGSGLGLSIVVDLLYSIKSKLSIYSVKNKGSNFSFELPVGIISDDIPIMDKVEKVFSTEFIQPNYPGLSPEFDNNKIILIENEKVKITQEISQTENENRSDTQTVCYEKPLDIRCIADDTLYKNIAGNESELILNDGNVTFLGEKEEQDSMGFILDDNSKDKGSCSVNKSLSKRNKKKKVCSGFNNPYKIKRTHSSNAVSYNKNNNININIYSGPENMQSDFQGKDQIKSRKSSKHRYHNNEEPHRLIPKDYLYKVIILDDDPTYVNQIKRQIYSFSPDTKKIYIDTANDPIEGLYKVYYNLKEGNILYDIVFIDENMPFMKGSTFSKLYKELLQNNGFYKVPFICISSEVTMKSDLRSYMDDHLNKPCRKKDLKYILQKYLKKFNF